MAQNYSVEKLEYLINHCFLPPVLPHAAEDPEQKPKLEAVLLEATIASLARYRNRCPLKDRVAARLALHGLQAAEQVHDTSTRDINEDRLATWLAKTVKEGLDVPVPLHVRSQNCGVVVRRGNDGLTFEAFELSATNSMVTGTTGRLIRAFPSSAVLIDNKNATQKDFQATVAHWLASMACEPAAAMQPQVQKAGKTVDELRDTVNPAIVTNLFFGAFLEAVGKHKDVPTLTKATRDEVLWRDTLSPWRRSPMWLLIRVFIHTTFQRAGSPDGFKRYMAVFLSDILDSARQASLPSALLYAMSAKISRRLVKLGAPLPAQLLEPLSDILDGSSRVLQETWHKVQGLEQSVDTSRLQLLRLGEDSLIQLPSLEYYLDSIADRHSKDSKTFAAPDGYLLNLPTYEWPCLPGHFPSYEVANLSVFEDWVATSLRQCMNAYDADSACREAYLLMKSYHALAGSIYVENPEGASAMILTLMEIWVRCDEKATDACELLAKYDPRIPTDVFQNLLLPSTQQMARLLKVENYLASRSGSGQAHSMFEDPSNPNCFAAQYFDREKEHTGLMEQIQYTAAARKAEKLADLEHRKNERKDLKERSDKESHAEREVQQYNRFGKPISSTKEHDDGKCKKCSLMKQANSINIDVYEWPLPTNPVKAKAVVFELDPPRWFVAWRDCTAFLISNVLKAEYMEAKKSTNRWELKDNLQLKSWYKPRSSQRRRPTGFNTDSDETYGLGSASEISQEHNQEERIVMASATKPFRASHRKAIPVSDATGEANVILPSGAEYRLYDLEENCFVGRQDPSDLLARLCTYRMPRGSQILGTNLFRSADCRDGASPNSTVARQFTCPVTMTLNEFLELCAVPFGHLLQWRHVALQLHSPSVDLGKEETALVFLQCIYQTGPAADPGSYEDLAILRASHGSTRETNLLSGLLAGLEESLDRIKQNWESANSVLILAAIATRLSSVHRSTQDGEQFLRFLQRCRSVAIRWLEVLREKMQGAAIGQDRTDFLSKSIEVACICLLTFDLDLTQLATVLADVEQASLLIQSSIILSEIGTGAGPQTGSLYAVLKLRVQRILWRSHKLLQRNHAALDDGIRKSWAAYRPGPFKWSVVWDTWVTKHVTLAGADMAVHLDLLSGELRVNGERLKRTPREFEAQPLYSTLFGKVGLDVMESRVPGMRFSVKKELKGFNIHLNLKHGCELIVQARNDGNMYEVLPHRLFERAFPQAFLDEYVHWYNEANDTIEFRPKHSPWNLDSPETWTLSRHGLGQWRLSKNDKCLIARNSNTSAHIATLLSPLVDDMHIHLFLDASMRCLDIDTPSLQLGFYFVQGTTHLLSKEFRGMAVDSNQQLGTLVGFQNKLLLKNAMSGHRLALILEGPVSYHADGDHLSIRVDRALVSKVHPIEVDGKLQRLVDNGSMQCKLFMAFIHALTSFCLPDPLTQKTGTEQALSILNSAALRSFDELTDANKKLLSKIAKLTPARGYYPKDERLMQTVSWDPELSFLSQHGWFYKIVKAIFLQAKRSSFFYPEKTTKLPHMDHVVESLHDRDAIRSATFCISGYGGEDHTIEHDLEYTTGDRDQHFAAAANASKVAFMVHKGCDRLVWKAPTLKQLWGSMESIPIVPGAHGQIDGMKYDPSLLTASESSALQYILPLHSRIAKAHGEGRTLDKYALMSLLATLAFSPNTNLDILQTVALISAVPELRGISVPDVEYCSPGEGRTCKTDSPRDILRAVVVDAAVHYQDSPDFRSAQRPKETPQSAEIRRQQDFDRKTKNAAKVFVEELRNQWPVKTPETPQKPAGVTDYIDVPEAMRVVKPKFQTWWNNEILYQYLHQIEEAMAGLERMAINVPDQKLKPGPRRQLPSQRCISIDHLFAGQAPSLPASASQAPQLEVCETAAIPMSIPRPQDSPLGMLIESMQSTSSGFETEYLNHLQRSLASLYDQRHSSFEEPPTPAELEMHVKQCRKHVETLFARISAAMRDSQRAVVGHSQPIHSPRLSPVLLIQQLSRRNWEKLSLQWKAMIVKYGLALSAQQHAERLVRASTPQALVKELQNAGHTNWDPMEYPESLLLEVESGIIIREVQEDIAAEMRTPRNGNSVMQLNMGEGKSSVIVPMVASALANGSQLVRVVVAKPQSKQMAQMLISKLGGLLNRRIYYMPFSRAVEATSSMAQAIQRMYQECMAEGGVLLVQPEHILSFKLMGLECSISANDHSPARAAQLKEVGQQLVRIQDFFDSETRDIVDESDEIFSVKFELVYTMGSQRDIELAPNRWQHIQEILKHVRAFGGDLNSKRPSALEYNDHGERGFPRIRILESDAGEELVRRIAKEICDHGNLEFKVDKSVKDAVLVYITKYDLTKDEIAAVEKSTFWTANNRPTLLLLRGLFATGILAFTLVPYRAKDSPTPRSEFSHPDVVILLTSLSYYYGGLTDEDLFLAFGHLMKSDNAAANYTTWVDDIDIPNEFRDLGGINLKDRPTCVSLVFPPLRHAKGVVDYFLSNIVFRKEMREFPNKLSTSGWDIAKLKNHPTTGFSGTNDSRVSLPQSMRNLDLDSQNHTNALVLDYLLRRENSVALMPQVADNRTSDAERLLDMVLAMRPAPQVILDVGAQILELGNEAVAETWLRKCADPQKEAAVFCNDSDELMVIDRKGIRESLQTSSYSTRLDCCLVYLDEVHTRGIDLKLPQISCAAVTLGAALTKDRMVQACMRMRELGKGQTVIFCVSAEIEAKIRACRPPILGNMPLGVDDVVRWTIAETFEEIRRSMPLWAMQGHRFVLQQQYWSQITSDGKTRLNPEYAKKFLEPEAKTIESRYSPGDRFSSGLEKLNKSSNENYKKLAARCREFDHLQTNSRRFQEEQERELMAESEEERVIENAVPAEPAEHYLSPALERLVQAGKLVDKHGNIHWPRTLFSPAFEFLRGTTAAAELELDQLVPTAAILATKDFGRTIEDVDSDSPTDCFQRPVQWILTIRPSGQNVATVLILISPFEAQGLMKHVIGSPFAALHLYRPRRNLCFQPTSKLDFLTVSISRSPISIPPQLSVQLNVFAGALYFNDFQEYKATCEYLGLASEPAQAGWEIDPDGFIRRDGQGRKGGESGLDRSPIKFLKVLLMKIRRTGEDLAATDMGKLLEGKLLKPEDFVRRL